MKALGRTWQEASPLLESSYIPNKRTRLPSGEGARSAVVFKFKSVYGFTVSITPLHRVSTCCSSLGNNQMLQRADSGQEHLA